MPTAPEKHHTSAHDETLFTYLRTLSVEERLALNDAAINTIEELRASYGERSKTPQHVKKP